MKIACKVTFLRAEDGGRRTAPRNSPSYRPHVVVGDPGQRTTALDASGVPVELYLGVCFTGPDEEMALGLEHDVVLALLWWPEVDHGELGPGSTFTIREGHHIVGFGRVLDWLVKR